MSTKTKFNMTLVQVCAKSGFESNLEYSLDIIDRCAEHSPKPDVIALPEVFLMVGASEKEKYRNSVVISNEADCSQSIIRFKDMAKKHQISLLLGSVLEQIPGESTRFYNTSVWIGPKGTIDGVYRKLKLFRCLIEEVKLDETNFMESGAMLPPVIDTPIGKVGLTICFDLRFPDLFQHLTRLGAQVIFVPACFADMTGQKHWEILLRSRAIENQVYIAAPNQCGEHYAGRISYGNSMIIDPWGEIVSRGDYNRPCVVTGVIDLDYVKEIQHRIPMLHGHRGLYEAS